MRFIRKLFLFIVSLVALMAAAGASHAVLAAGGSFATIVNPVRGNEFWQLQDQTPETNVQNAYNQIAKRNLPATWLLRYDALIDPKITTVITKMTANQEIGLFLEITPSLCKAAQVQYHDTGSWHNAGSLFLTGYTQAERAKLLDTLVAQYQQTFHRLPQSVGAWWIDAFSLKYLKDHYGISAAMIVADQYTTDNYQIWGQYWSVPYIPSSVNTLMPAATPVNATDVVLIQWANRDPYNGYGNAVYESTYSVQANDYLPYHNETIDYFKKLFDIYVGAGNTVNQVTVGLEDDFSWAKFGDQYAKQLQVVADANRSGTTFVVTMSQFAQNFHNFSDNTNGVSVIAAKNPLGRGEVVWYMSPYYRVGWFATDAGSVIRDMRLYFDSKEEPCLTKSCQSLNFAFSDSKALDDATYGENWLIDSGQIANISITRTSDSVKITYKNKIGTTREIDFSPHDVAIDGHAKAASETIIEAINAAEQQNQPIAPTIMQVQMPVKRLVLGFGLFVIFVLFVVYLPGRALTKFLAPTFTMPLQWSFETTVGLVVVTTFSYIFGLLKISPIPVAILLVGFGLFGIWRYRIHFAVSRSLLLTLFCITIVALYLLVPVVKSGLPFSYGLGFWGPNGHDAIWHLALITQLMKQIPPQNPVFAGVTLTNYHYFFDLFVADVGIITKINTLDLLFRFVPFLLALLFAGLVFGLAKKLSNSTAIASLSLFFAVSAGSFGWVITLARHQGVAGESMFWAMQSPSLLLNLPFAISAVILLAILSLLAHFGRTFKISEMVLMVLLAASLAEFKVYAAILVLGAFAIIALVDFWWHRSYRLMIMTAILVVTNGILVLINTTHASGLLILSPFWFINTMLEAPDRLYWPRLVLSRDSGNKIKFLGAEFIGFTVFIIGNLGVRIIAALQLLKWRQLKNLSLVYTVMIFIALMGFLLPLFFIQKSTSWNTIQFFYYSLFMLDFFAGFAVYKFWQIKFSQIIKLLIIVIVVLTAVPATIATFRDYSGAISPARLPYPELDALTFLSRQPTGTVLTYPFSETYSKKWADPKPLFAYTTTGYVAAFSGQPTYLEDEINNDIIGSDIATRKAAQIEIFRNQNGDFIQNFLTQNKIRYLYLPVALKPQLDDGLYGVKQIYQNSDVAIYQVE